MPWLGVDPLPPAAEIITAAGQLYRQVPGYDPVAVSIGHVEDVGRFNIIGERVALWGTIRCVEEPDMTLLQDNLRRMAEHHAAAYGCTAAVEYDQYVPPVTNTPEWLDKILPTVRRVVGDDNVVEIPPALGYDDISVFVRKFGGVYLNFGTQDTRLDGLTFEPLEGGRGLIPNHNPAFYVDDGALVTSLRVHVHVAVDHLLAGSS
jgi:amidohydrolase